ncbi:cation transport-related protein [Crassisporium funariophilum]|nr:cation transport-related protein [Crassisporium funariophilum]
MAFTSSDICKIIIAIFIPPLGVFLERGCGADLLINILLTILGYIPGIFHGKFTPQSLTSR